MGIILRSGANPCKNSVLTPQPAEHLLLVTQRQFTDCCMANKHAAAVVKQLKQ